MSTMRATLSDARPVDEGVSVRWHDAAVDADGALRSHVADVVGVDPALVQVGRLCGRCGSSDHGRPWVSHGAQVSLARSGPHLLTAVSTSGPVGVDVERAEDVDRAWDDLVAQLEPGGVLKGTGRAALWCRTEAVLKRDGRGLAGGLDLAKVEVGRVDDLVAPAGYCAAVAFDA